MVTLDSRAVKPGDTFVAVKGERVDGHDFIADAKARGAVRIIDGVEELQSAAREYRRGLGAKVIAVTGSAGKTTVKEFLKTFLRCYGTEGNFNNHLGLPLTLLNAPRSSRYIVVEMGTNHPGEIAALCDIAEPDIGVIASIGTAHLEFFKTQRGIAEEKGVLFSRTKEFNVVAADCNELETLEKMSAARLFKVDTSSTRGLVCPLPGAHSRSNMMLAWTVAEELGVGLEEAAERLEKFALPGARWRKTKIGEVVYIDDSYNANPDSMKAAIDAFGGKVVVLGDMGELGPRSRELHREVLAYAYAKGLKVVTVGRQFALAELDLISSGEVLLKGSHAMNLSSLIDERKQTK